MKNFVLRPDILSPRFLKFCVVGFANALVDFLCYSVFLWMSLPPYASRSISWILACLFSYLANKTWTFNARDRGAKPLLRFAIVNICSLSLGIILLYAFKSWGCGNRLAFLLSLPFTTITNYLGYRFWSFKLITPN